MEKLLDVVNELRHSGLNGVLSLPQIVVCGDQSASKSSVLEAFTKIPFPRNAGLCTRFATEIILRRDTKQTVAATILSDDAQTKFPTFPKSFTDLAELPGLIQEATEVINAAHQGNGRTPTMKAFLSEILNISVSAPTLVPLTLVDLPGLIHAETASQSRQDIEFVGNLVEKYIKNPRSIILAVVSARSDYANQVILQKARNVDPRGSRTLGVITKPDCLDDGSEEERSWIALFQNKDIKFDLGWHLVRNRTQLELHLTTDEHEAIEKEFFTSRAAYRFLPDHMLGSTALYKRLTRLLFAHLKREIPNLDRELNLEFNKTLNRLDRLGEQRNDVMEIRSFLTKAGAAYQRLLSEALTGNYNNDPFFLEKIGSMAFSAAKLRAAIRFHNSAFSEQMHRFGGKYTFSGIPAEVQECLGSGSDSKISGPDNKISPWQCTKNSQYVLSRTQAIQWVLQKMPLSRGEELPGCFNTTLMKELYWEQTSNWGPITLCFINNIVVPCVKDFSRGLLNHILPQDVADRVWRHKVQPCLAVNQNNAVQELEDIIGDKSRAPMTYNHYFTDTVQKMRNEKILTRARRIVETNAYAVGGVSGANTKKGKVVDAETILQALTDELIEPDMDKFTAEDTLDCLMALYKDKLKIFIAAITEQVIERHLIEPLRESTISPVALLSLGDDEVRSLAAEPDHVSAERKALNAVLASLREGKKIFDAASF